MAFKTFVDGNPAPASDINTYLMKQSVIGCTSVTRPASPQDGMTIYETDTDRLLIYNGSAWKPLAGGLPAEVAAGSNNSLVSVTASGGVWAALPGATATSVSIVLPYDCLVQISCGIWAAVTASSYLAFDYALSGATTKAAGVTAGYEQWGRVPRIPFGGANSGSMQITETKKLLAGTTTVTLQCLRDAGTTTSNVSYPSLRVTPVDWA